jgi:FlaA1/EpsC-like NDP-sugar epimerase
MGASKRLAELVIQAHADAVQTAAQTDASEGPLTCFSVVRFGNVLGSSGSVVPLFRLQIEQGGPITLTHADVARYFMTIPEASELVIQAGAMASGGDVFVLDMGEPVRIYDLAQRMVELAGFRVRDAHTPHGQIEIQVTGLRPGEKLYEELLIGDDPQPTELARVMKAREHFLPWSELEAELALLDAALKASDLLAVRAQLERLTGYTPDGAVVDWVERARLEKQPGPVTSGW